MKKSPSNGSRVIKKTVRPEPVEGYLKRGLTGSPRTVAKFTTNGKVAVWDNQNPFALSLSKGPAGNHDYPIRNVPLITLIN
ncbi:MAG: hypothetical protein VW985_08075, partial [Gammaproteobacteria bacterium]